MVNDADIDLMGIYEDYYIFDLNYKFWDQFALLSQTELYIGILFIDNKDCNPEFARLMMYKERIKSFPGDGNNGMGIIILKKI